MAYGMLRVQLTDSGLDFTQPASMWPAPLNVDRSTLYRALAA